MNDLKEPYRLNTFNKYLWALVLLMFCGIVTAYSQCPNLGEAFYYTGCLEGDQPEYETCCNWCMEYYQVFEFIVPQNATSTVFMVDDSEVVWSHVPNSSDLYVDFIVFDQCNESVLYSSYNGWCDESVEVITASPSIRNDAYEVELNLPAGAYYLAIPTQGATGNSTISGCFGITVFSPTVLDLSVKERTVIRQMLRHRVDASGRRW